MPIRLNKEKHEKESIKLLLKQAVLNPNYELECIIGGNARLGSIIEQDQFNRILSRIRNKNEYIGKASRDKLMICFPTDSKYSDLRVMVTGYHNINKYCRTEKLDSILDNVIFQTKRKAPEKITRVPVPNYNLRFNLKLEEALDTDNGLVRELLRDWPNVLKIFRYKQEFRHVSPDNNFAIDCSIVRTSAFEDREITIKEVLARDLMRNVVKPSSEKTGFGDWWRKISADKSTLVRVRDVNIYHKSVKDSQLFESVFMYEVEVEYLGNQNSVTKKTFMDSKADDKEAYINMLFASIFAHIGLVLQCVQDSFHIMSSSDIIAITNSFSKLTGVPRGIDKLFFGPLPIDLDRNNMIRLPNYDDMSRVYGGGNILLDYCVCDKIDGMRYLLYLDREGNCYLIGRDSAVIIKDMGLRIAAFANSVFDGEYVANDKDGEFINRFYIFDAFYIRGESLMRHPFGQLDNENGRLFHVKRLAMKYDDGEGVEHAPGVSSKYAFKLAAQTYMFGEKSSTDERRRNYASILEHGAYLLGRMNRQYGGMLEEGHLFTYKTDGLVFKPVELSVYQTHLDNEVPDDVLSASRKWNLMYKWKPQELLTMDLRVEFLKDIKSRRRQYIYLDNKKYAKCVLKARNYNSYEWQRSGYANSKHNNTRKVESYLGMTLVNDNINLYNMPGEIEFHAVYPFIGYRDIMGNIQTTSHECLLPVNGDDTVLALNGDIIYDGYVVEFRYHPFATTIYNNDTINDTINDVNAPIAGMTGIQGQGQGKNNEYNASNKEPGLRWQAIKIRPNKSPNDLNTCLDIWRLIHSPTDKNMIIVPEARNKLMNPAYDSGGLNYYIPGWKGALYAPELYKFVNFGKQWLIDRYISMFTGPKVVDLGCGKLADFFKYVHGDATMLLAIDSNPDNLNNKTDGAALRIINNIRNSPRIKSLASNTMLLLGNMCRDLQAGDIVSDELNRYYLDVLMGRFQPSPQFNSKHPRFYGALQNGCHLAVSMYSIQHCLNSVSDINNFLNNASLMLKDQGYLIGCCLDGNEIASDVARGKGHVEGRRDGNLVWSVRLVESGEQYYGDTAGNEQAEGYTFDDGDTGADVPEKIQLIQGENVLNYSIKTSSQMLGPGNMVDIYQENHSTAVRQNLVDIRYIANRAREYGLKLIETRRFTEEPGSLVTEWASTDIGSGYNANSTSASRNKRVIRKNKSASNNADGGDGDKELANAVKAIRDMPVLEKWCSWQRYFVFQKVQS